MKRTNMIAAGAVLIAIASTAVVATAHDRGNGPREGRGAEMLFETFDLDADGVITKAEIEGAAAARFAAADTDGDGNLSLEEMTAAREARDQERHADRVAKRLERHDTNGDGVLSLEEATAVAKTGRMEKMFDRIDADGDGTITKAEVEDAQGMFRRGGHKGKGHGKN